MGRIRRRQVSQLIEISSAFKRAVDVDGFLYKNPFVGVNLAAEAAGVDPELGSAWW